MEDPEPYREINSTLSICYPLESLESCSDIINIDKKEINEEFQKEVIKAALKNIKFKGCYWRLYDVTKKSDPNINLKIKLHGNIPVIGKYFIILNDEEILSEKYTRYIVPDEDELSNYIFSDSGKIYKNGELVKTHIKDKTAVIYAGKSENSRTIILKDYMWELFAENKLELGEQVKVRGDDPTNINIENLYKETKTRGERPVLRIDVRTKKIEEYRDANKAYNDIKEELDIKESESTFRRWASKGEIRYGYKWKRKDYKIEKPKLLQLAPTIIQFTIIKEIDKNEFVELLYNRIGEKRSQIFKTITDAAHSKIKSQKFAYGYFWDKGYILSKSYELENMEIINENTAVQRVIYVSKLKDDILLSRKPKCICIGDKIYYENGKYKIYGRKYIKT